jgi:hypothetical protein
MTGLLGLPQLEEAGSVSTRQRERVTKIDDEEARLVRFVVTMDAQHLPAGFEDRVKAYRALRAQMRAVQTPNLAVMGP